MVTADNTGSEDRIRHVFDGGHFRTEPVCLGDMEALPSGELLVRGGWGESHSRGKDKKTKCLEHFADNDDWYDDTSDGSVVVRLEFPGDKKPVETEPAWVIVGPPDYAPQIENLVTLYDLARYIAICAGLRMAPAKPDFTRDIKPLLGRVIAYQWVNKYAWYRHGRGSPYDFEGLEFWKRLGDPAADAGLRQRVFNCLRDPNSDKVKSDPTDMPRMHDDLGHFGEYNVTRVLAFLPFQYEMLRKWCKGEFFGADDPDPGPFPVESLTDKIDRVSMEACVGVAVLSGDRDLGDHPRQIPLGRNPGRPISIEPTQRPVDPRPAYRGECAAVAVGLSRLCLGG